MFNNHQMHYRHLRVLAELARQSGVSRSQLCVYLWQ